MERNPTHKEALDVVLGACFLLVGICSFAALVLLLQRLSRPHKEEAPEARPPLRRTHSSSASATSYKPLAGELSFRRRAEAAAQKPADTAGPAVAAAAAAATILTALVSDAPAPPAAAAAAAAAAELAPRQRDEPAPLAHVDRTADARTAQHRASHPHSHSHSHPHPHPHEEPAAPRHSATITLPTAAPPAARAAAVAAAAAARGRATAPQLASPVSPVPPGAPTSAAGSGTAWSSPTSAASRRDGSGANMLISGSSGGVHLLSGCGHLLSGGSRVASRGGSRPGSRNTSGTNMFDDDHDDCSFVYDPATRSLRAVAGSGAAVGSSRRAGSGVALHTAAGAPTAASGAGVGGGSGSGSLRTAGLAREKEREMERKKEREVDLELLSRIDMALSSGVMKPDQATELLMKSFGCDLEEMIREELGDEALPPGDRSSVSSRACSNAGGAAGGGCNSLFSTQSIPSRPSSGTSAFAACAPAIGGARRQPLSASKLSSGGAGGVAAVYGAGGGSGVQSPAPQSPAPAAAAVTCTSPASGANAVAGGRSMRREGNPDVLAQAASGGGGGDSDTHPAGEAVGAVAQAGTGGNRSGGGGGGAGVGAGGVGGGGGPRELDDQLLIKIDLALASGIMRPEQATDILKSYGCNLEGLLCDELSGGGGEVTASASRVAFPPLLE